MELSLNGKTALVTGAARGIGEAISIMLAEAGADIIAVDLEEGMLAEVKSKIEALGRKVLTFTADVTDTDRALEVVKSVISEWGKIDILVNNAGITRDNLIIRMKEADWDAVLAVNTKGAFNFCRAASRYMLKARSGCIVNIASVIGIMGNAGQVNYSASKAALIGMTKSLAKELAPKNVRVNAVAPGYIITAMTDGLPDEVKETIGSQIPLGRLGTPEDVAKAVLFLASDAACYTTGDVLLVSGGMAM